MKPLPLVAMLAAVLVSAAALTGCGNSQGDANVGINTAPQPSSAGKLPTSPGKIGTSPASGSGGSPNSMRR